MGKNVNNIQNKSIQFMRLVSLVIILALITQVLTNAQVGKSDDDKAFAPGEITERVFTQISVLGRVSCRSHIILPRMLSR